MKRYKTVLLVLCPNEHKNLVDDRVTAESAEQAKNSTLANIQRKKCAWCNSPLTNKVHLLGQEEIPLYESYTILGYICACGEKVEVLRAAKGTGFSIPEALTVQCSKGHSRTILNQEFVSLEMWTEQTQ